MQCGQFRFAYIYTSHFNCVGVVSVVSSPDYTSHVVLDRPRGNRRVKKTMQEPNGHPHRYIWSSVLSTCTCTLHVVIHN